MHEDGGALHGAGIEELGIEERGGRQARVS